MAGYYLNSLDWDVVNKFLSEPTSAQILRLANMMSDLLDEIDADLEDDAIMASWPSEPSELSEVIREHLKKTDWYRSLGPDGEAWEGLMLDFLDDKNHFDSKFHANDCVYWNVVTEAIAHHKNAGLDFTELSHIGTRPFNYQADNCLEEDSFWHPVHSMHTPEETVRIREQFIAAESTVLASRHEDAVDDYEVVMKALDEIVSAGRMLLVTVDT